MGTNVINATINALDAMLKDIADSAEAWCAPDETVFYVPTCYGDCVPEVTRLEEEISAILGGSTEWDGRGCWCEMESPTDDQCKTIECEPVRVIQSMSSCIDVKKAERLRSALRKYGEAADQSEIGVKTGGIFRSIPTRALR